MQTAVHHPLLSLEQKKALAKELWDYHDVLVQSDCSFAYFHQFNIAERSFKEQLSGRRGNSFKGSQVQFVIDFLIDRTSERGIKEIFLRLFQAMPEAYGYLLPEDEPLPFDTPKLEFQKSKKGLGKVVNQRKQ